MKIKYLEAKQEIPSCEIDLDFDEEPRVEWHEWVSEIKVMVDEGGICPTRGHSTDAGFDLYAPKDMPPMPLWRGDSITIDTKIHMLLPEGTCGVIISKSGLNVKHNVTSHGLVDSQYTGSIKVKLYNHGEERLKIEPGDKISQIVIMPCYTPRLVLTNKLPMTERGDESLGSTGRK